MTRGEEGHGPRDPREDPPGPMRLYRRVLRLLPRDFRDEFGPDMERLLRDRLREAGSDPRAVRRLAVAAAADVVWQAGREWASRGARGLTTMTRETMTMDGWMKDVSFGIRTLLRRPSFTLAAMVTLALGIGATVAIFTVVNGVLLAPLPYPDSDDLFEVRVLDTERGTQGTTVDHPDIRVWQERVEGVRIAGYTDTRPTLTGMGHAEVVDAAQATDGLMQVLGVSPELGRDLRRDDDIPDGPRVVVVSHRFWTERLARDPDVLGRTITLDGEPWQIVGVAPQGFDFPAGASLWLPRRHDVEDCGHGCRVLRAIGRLEPGTSLEMAEERFIQAADVLAETSPGVHGSESHRLRRLVEAEVADVRTGLWVLFGAVIMVLLIACANVANLLLARGGSRRTEVALRATLGASRARIVRQLLTESLLLALAGGVTGLVLAMWGTGLLLRLAPQGLPRLDQVAVDGTVVGFTALVVVAVTVLFGLLPARELSRASLFEGMGAGRGTSGDRRAGTFRSLLLVGEVALSLSLLLGAGLMLRTLAETRSVELGFRTQSVERFRLSLPESRYDSLEVAGFFEQLEREITQLPQVESAGLGFGIPFASGSIFSSFELLGRPDLPEGESGSMPVRLVTPGYLEAAGITLLRGRWLEFSDRRDARPVAVLNAAAADRYFPASDPVGTPIELDVHWGFGDDPTRTVVGVVGHVRSRSATEEPGPAVYVPNAQFSANSMYTVLHLAPGVESAMDPVRDVLRGLDPNLAVTNVHRIEDVLRSELAPTRFYLTLLGVFSVLAVVLASVGLYGVVAFLVTRRTREIGIRIALGARSEEVVRMIVRQGVRPAVVGMIVGLGASLLGVRVLRGLLYGVSPYDPVTLVAVTIILGLVVLVATVLPAARATRVEPATALREE